LEKRLKGEKVYFAHGFSGISPSWWEGYDGAAHIMVDGQEAE
jgi:hypothetical protein